MSNNWGRDITYRFYPLKDDGRNGEDISQVATAPSIFVFDQRPTRVLALAGDPGLSQIGAEIILWSNTADNLGKEFTIPAIPDPDPSTELNRKTYFLGINFILQTTEQVQTVVRALPIQRVQGHHQVFGVTRGDLEGVFATIDSLQTNTQQDIAIRLAQERIKISLDAKGFEFAQMWRPDDLNLAVVYRALSQIMLGLIADTGDEWETRFKEYRLVHEDIIASIKIEYDSNNNGEPETKLFMGRFLRATR